MVSACIFDLDGVIVDTADFHYLSWKRLASQLGFDFTEKQNEAMKGISRMDSLDVVLSIGKISASPSEKQKMAHVKNEWYKEYLQSVDDSVILPGVKDFLQDLQLNNIPYALGSASKNAGFVMSKIGISDGFTAIFDGNDTINSKPHPEVFLKGASALGIDPKYIIVFEDSFKGVTAANTGGFMSCGIGKSDVLHNADHVLKSLENISFDSVRKLFEEIKES